MAHYPGYPNVAHTATTEYQSRFNTEEGSTVSNRADFVHRPANAIHGGVYDNRQPSYQHMYEGQAQVLGGYSHLSTESVDRQHILGEEIVEHTITVPTKRTYEEQIMVQKVINVPETVRREEIVEEQKTVRQKIVKVKDIIMRPVVKEVEVYEERENIIEVPKVVYSDNLITQWIDAPQEKVVYDNKEVEVPRFVYVDEIVEVDQPVVKVIPKHEILEKEVIKEVLQPQYQEVEIPMYVTKEVIEVHDRNIPVAVEKVIHEKYHLPELENEYEEVSYPLFVPVIIEVAVPAEYMTNQTILEAENLRNQVVHLMANPMPSLCQVEGIAQKIRNFVPEQVTDPNILRDRMAHKIADLQGPGPHENHTAMSTTYQQSAIPQHHTGSTSRVR